MAQLKNEENGKNENKVNADALVYFVKSTGKAVIDLIQNVAPQLKKFDDNMQIIGVEADKLNQKRIKTNSKKINKKIKKTETMEVTETTKVNPIS